ncbi:MAG: amidohydrolase family protein [Clostridiales bacterium]|nr:amidohydrolase family protein [Clostridiales bacterium]
MKLFQENIVVNWHEHVWFDDRQNLDIKRFERLLDAAHKTNTDYLVCSLPLTRGNPTPTDMRRCNDVLYEAMKHYPDMIKGMAFVNPGYVKESLDEVKRCIDELGMIGVKLYNQYHISDPVVRSLIEQCIELDIPILQHAGKLNFMPQEQPFISDGTHFAKVAIEYPEAIIIHAHVGGGGDWQWAIKAIADHPNIFIDTSGSVHDEGIIEDTIEALGAKRMLFGTDGSYCAGVGKILSARITYDDKLEILNNKRFTRYLARGL